MDSTSHLPALKVSASGKQLVDYRVIATLAFPLFLDSFTYILIGLTDTWFMGRVSTDAVAAAGAISWILFLFIMLLACTGVAVQTKAAQAYGSGSFRQASEFAWMGIWFAALTVPVYGVLATYGNILLLPFQLDYHIEQLALLYWFPRMLGGAIVVADWTFRGFFNAVNRTHLTIIVSSCILILNVVFNALFVFLMNWGIAGIAWATVVAEGLGLIIQFGLFLSPQMKRLYKTHKTWHPNALLISQVAIMGIFSGLFMVSDIVGLAFFQMIQTELGVVSGAATQIVVTLLSLSYQPIVGLGEAGIILVGQSIGAGEPGWAKQVGNAVIRLSVFYMVIVGLGLAVAGTWAISLFVDINDAQALRVLEIGPKFLWIAVTYQLFHALVIASTFCLQGAEDVRVPALSSLILTLCGFVPLAHMLSFGTGQGFIRFLPSFGFGTFGGWWVYAGYMIVLGSILWKRWDVLSKRMSCKQLVSKEMAINKQAITPAMTKER